MRNFKTTEYSDYDYRVCQRVFSGRMTKGRWKKLDRYCRTISNYDIGRCGHEWDCCGCLCRQNMSFEYKQNQVVILFSQSFNY